MRKKDPIIIEPYSGYANDKYIYAKARVLEDENIKVSKDDGILKNVINSYKRLESDEVAGAKVIATWAGGHKELISDNEGYINLEEEHNLDIGMAASTWLSLSYHIIEPDNGFVASTEVLNPGSNDRYAVISDLDDTVIETGVSSLFKWRLMLNSLSKGAQKRLPLAGAQEFYQALSRGNRKSGSTPFFYISNSPWNLYRYLTTFLRHNEFPRGPVILRDMGFSSFKKKKFEDGDKYLNIARILQSYPHLKFILIGDAAEIDADIYIQISKNYPNQIKAIFIRAVKNKKLIRRVEKIIEKETDVEVKLFEQTEQAILHARHLGLVV